MSFRDGDIVTFDGTEMEVTRADPDGYVLQESQGGGYFSTVFITKDRAEELIKAGRLKTGKLLKTEDGSGYCSYHVWKKYVGVREVYSFCQHCNAKEFKDWRLIKDEKDY